MYELVLRNFGIPRSQRTHYHAHNNVPNFTRLFMKLANAKAYAQRDFLDNSQDGEEQKIQWAKEEDGKLHSQVLDFGGYEIDRIHVEDEYE